MKATKKNFNIDYKVYTSIPKNATFKLLDMTYRKTQITEARLPSDSELASFECVRADRILYLIDLLQYFQTKVLPAIERP